MNLIYLLGPGRSGTTLLAAVLGNQNQVLTLGEMNQFFEHLQNDMYCSCGEKLTECSFWKNIVQKLKIELNSNDDLEEIIQKESHSKILKLLLDNKLDRNYINYQELVFNTIDAEKKQKWYVDSSKYISRFLKLNKSKKLNIKGVYLVRDVRGVIHSFKKKVQTPKSSFSTIIYYLLLSVSSEITYRLYSNVIKIKYENFIENPDEVLSTIYEHLQDKDLNEMEMKHQFAMPHIIGGNRIKSKKSIQINKKIAWKEEFSRAQKIIYYIAALPIMLINKYKI